MKKEVRIPSSQQLGKSLAKLTVNINYFNYTDDALQLHSKDRGPTWCWRTMVCCCMSCWRCWGDRTCCCSSCCICCIPMACCWGDGGVIIMKAGGTASVLDLRFGVLAMATAAIAAAAATCWCCCCCFSATTFC